MHNFDVLSFFFPDVLDRVQDACVPKGEIPLMSISHSSLHWIVSYVDMMR